MKKETVKTEIYVNDNTIRIKRINNVDYISITDLARYANPDDPSGVIRNWMSNKNSFSFYSLWEELNNPNFNSVESHGIKINEVPYNRFTMTPNRWKKEFNAIGIVPSSGKYSDGTMTAKEWRGKNPELAKDGNIRDYTDLLHLIILNNLENINAELIELGMSQGERLVRLNNSAKKQIELLKNSISIKELEVLRKQ